MTAGVPLADFLVGAGGGGGGGATGPTGPTGATGATGSTGAAGESSSLFLYRANTGTTSGYPGDGDVLWNNVTQASATQINISHLTTDNIDIDIFLSLIATNSHFTLQDQNNSSNYQIWHVTGTPTNVNPGLSNSYWTIPVTLHSSGGTGTTNFPTNHQIFLGIVIGAVGPTGPASTYIVQFDTRPQSTTSDSTNKLNCGEIYFDPTDLKWNLSPTSTATFKMLLEVTNTTNVAHGELFQLTGTGSPQIIGTVATVNTVTATLVSIDVSTTFRSNGVPGIYQARCWVNTSNGLDYATCDAAWLEITP